MITPFEIYPHFDTLSSEDCKILAVFEHDIQRIMIYICKEGAVWNRIYLHYDDLENHVVQQVCYFVVPVSLFSILRFSTFCFI